MITSPPPTLHVLIAPQAFKGSLDAVGVAEAISVGVRAGWPWSMPPTITLLPLADGGEGTLQALVRAAGPHGSLRTLTVTGPFYGQSIPADIGWLDDGYPTAVIEMAQAAGLPLIAPAQRDPMRTTTYGVGELLLAALDGGARRILVTLGGSGTNDGGAGMAQALGARFLDTQGDPLHVGGGALAQLARIDSTHVDPRLAQVELIGLTDVTNPLCGPQGASAIYGPQKGATPAQVVALDAALANYAALIARDLGRDVAQVAGAGAAGGLGAGLLAFGGPQVRLASGADFVLTATNFAEHLRHSDLLFTGEGRIDGQIAFGKLTGAVAAQALRAQVPTLCVVGGVADGYEAAYTLGITAIIIANDGPQTLPEAMAHAPQLIADSVARALRLWHAMPLTRFPRKEIL